MGVGNSEGLWVALRAMCPSLGSISLQDLCGGWGFCLKNWRLPSVRGFCKISEGPLGSWGPAEGSQPREGDWGTHRSSLGNLGVPLEPRLATWVLRKHEGSCVDLGVWKGQGEP